jgi:hypothetical protein
MKRLGMSLLLALFIGVGVPVAVSAQSVDVFEICDERGVNSSICDEGAGTRGGDTAGLPAMVTIIINTLLVVLGMVAVLMIVIGGIRYSTSAGDAAQVKRAKDTILYSVIGLIVAIMAFSIVNFVLGRF